jgi:hypothetical protein
MTDWTNVNRDIEADDYGMIAHVADYLHEQEGTDFSEENRNRLREHFLKLKKCKCILEIGVDNNPDRSRTSTRTILDIKEDKTKYFGIDIMDKSYLDDPAKNIYTLKENSSNVDTVMDFVQSKGNHKIDFLFIDGWHSINQCEREWNGYTPHLSSRGIVGWHDSNHHYGPKWLTETVDREKWEVAEFPGAEPTRDFGISFAWRKKK